MSKDSTHKLVELLQHNMDGRAVKIQDRKAKKVARKAAKQTAESGSWFDESYPELVTYY